MCDILSSDHSIDRVQLYPCHDNECLLVSRSDVSGRADSRLVFYATRFLNSKMFVNSPPLKEGILVKIEMLTVSSKVNVQCRHDNTCPSQYYRSTLCDVTLSCEVVMHRSLTVKRDL